MAEGREGEEDSGDSQPHGDCLWNCHSESESLESLDISSVLLSGHSHVTNQGCCDGQDVRTLSMEMTIQKSKS